MVDLRAKPFYLKDEDIAWVERSIESMTLEEKIGQLFINLDNQTPPEEMIRIFDKYHIGGCRYFNKKAADVWEQNLFYQKHSKLPLLIAANCDSGGNGACSDGTYIASAAACGATADTETAYTVGLVSGREASALGCNWDFGPVADILLNWRNTIVNTRAFSNDADIVIENCKAYMKGVWESGMATCAKHFPGDGVEELDQHLMMGVNSLECDTWDKTYGKVYRSLIDEGVQSIMVGHIALPAYSHRLRPELKDNEIMPATLSPELLQDLLRGQLGFNGLILTDASHMVGMTASAPRAKAVPGAIAAGADMFLFFREPEEDFEYMMQGYRDGIITPERLHEALLRILGLKASLGLHKKNGPEELMPNKAGISVVGCPEHHEMARCAAKKAITLVKDTKSQLPIRPDTHPKLKVYVVSSAPKNRLYTPDPVREVIREELERAGFNVTMHENFYDMERKTPGDPMNGVRIMQYEKVEDFKKKYDAVLLFVNIQGYAQENTPRIRWSAPHTNETPWYVQEVPTVAVSLNFTTHLLDLPMMSTYINAYGATRTVVEEVIRKITGEEAFEGKANETVFCDRWDTRR